MVWLSVLEKNLAIIQTSLAVEGEGLVHLKETEGFSGLVLELSLYVSAAVLTRTKRNCLRSTLFGSDRSPRRVNLVCACVRALLSSIKGSKSFLERVLQWGPQRRAERKQEEVSSMVISSSLELSKSTHLLKTDIFEDFFSYDKLRKVAFLVAILNRIFLSPPKNLLCQKKQFNL